MENVITVPQDKCPLDVLADLEERIKNAWIFLHQDVVEKLLNTDGINNTKFGLMGHRFTWGATDEYPEKKVICDNFHGTGWYILVKADADEIDYKTVNLVSEPDTVILLRMAK